MRALFFFSALAAALFACQPKATESPLPATPVYTYFGDSISVENPLSSQAVLDSLSIRDSIELTFSSTITEVCQAKGCWMDIQLGDQLMMVKFWDYGFFVPKDAAGRAVVMKGWAKKTTSSVEWLKHKAQDAGASQDSIDKITEPTIGYDFMATGVAIQQ
jgi:hypothetical protein